MGYPHKHLLALLRKVPTLLGTVLLPRQSAQPLERFSSFPGRQVPFLGTALLPQAVSTVSRKGSSLVASQASQAGRQAGSLPRDSATSQTVSAVSRKGSSLVPSQASRAGRQASSLPGDSSTSKAGSAVPPNNIPTREGPSHAGNNPSTQAGRQTGKVLN